METLDKEKMEKAFQAFMKNPAWKAEFEKAPSDACKEYLKNEYYFSKYYDPEADDSEDMLRIMKEQENDLGVEDWEYLKKRAGNSPFAGYCNQKIKELSEK